MPIKGAITGIAFIMGTELYYRITRTATRKRVQAKFIPSTSLSHSHVYSTFTYRTLYAQYSLRYPFRELAKLSEYRYKTSAGLMGTDGKRRAAVSL